MSGQELDPPPPDIAPGEVLARAREEAGITLREVADALHLPISTVTAIETGDRAHLPVHVFTRGYLRAYAKLLDLDPDPLVAALVNDKPLDEGREPSDLSGNGPGGPPTWVRSLLVKPRIFVVATGAVVVLLLVWALSNTDDDTPPEAPAEEPTVPAAAAATPPMAQPGGRSRQVSGAQSDPARAPRRQAGTVDTLPQPVGIESALAAVPASAITAEVASDGSLQAPTSPRRLTPTGENSLAMEFSEDCWVEIKDSAGALLFGDLGKAGQRIEFVGVGPFRVLLGYAPGVLLHYNAEPVALAPHTRNNVASLVLGQ